MRGDGLTSGLWVVWLGEIMSTDQPGGLLSSGSSADSD